LEKEGSFINEVFLKLSQEKQERILNAAMEEFSSRGFKKASTNNIVQRAGISKGILFYYFRNKKELFSQLVDYAIKFIKNEYLDQLDDKEPDFLKRYSKAARLKMEAYAKNPHAFNFLGSIFLGNDDSIDEEIKEKIAYYSIKGRQKLFQNIDTSSFRKDIEEDLIFKLIYWSLEGYQQELISILKGKDLNQIDYDPYWKEFYSILSALRKAYYHNEEV